MNRILVALISLTLLCAACSHNKPIKTTKDKLPKLSGKTKDTLAYTYEGEGGESDSCNCDYIAITYPLFKTRTSLNDTIKEMVVGTLSEYNEDSSDTTKSLAVRVKTVVENNTSKVDTSEGQSVPTTYELHIRVMSQDSKVLVLEVEEDGSGGAHPNSRSIYINWDTKKDEEIVLDDVLVKDYSDKLDEIADKIIREEKLNEGLSDGGDTFALNSNYYFAPDGIHFYYNNYEIKSYMQGPTDLLIPYSKIKKLIRPGSVLSQYIK
ncbi:MAG TPA: RsiV family protein [Mucilaginibacter sp.]